MTSGPSSNERRRNSRLDGSRIAVTVRPRGRLAAIEAQAVDFNRHGIAVCTAQPLSKDRTLYLTLRCGEVCIDHLVGVVHNCVRQGQRFRSGIRFRLSSDLQRDRREVEATLASLEAALEAAREESA